MTFMRVLARRLACAGIVVASLAGAAPASAALPAACTDPFFDAGRIASGDVCRADVFSPETAADALATLGSPGSPEDDLLAALDELEHAPDGTAAAVARGRALAILEGDPARLAAGDGRFLDAKAYTGIPLLGSKAKVQDDLGPGATVDIREVRFGDHAILDTSMLRFRPEAMGEPFTIRWHVTELGTSFGGELSPAWVPRGAGTGRLALAEPLAPGPLDTGTSAVSRFHPAGAGEETRLITQAVTVQMPAPEAIAAILDPNLKPGHETYAQVAVGSTADPAPAALATTKVSALAPERMLWEDLVALDPAALDAAHALGRGDAELVDRMRSRDTLPAPDRAPAGADVTVQLANGEAYVSARELRVAPDTSPDGTVTLAVTNLDDADRTFAVRELHDRSQVFGVLDWGQFATDVLDTIAVPAGATRSVTVTPDPSAFSLWLGDPSAGDQAAMAVALDRGPRQISRELGEGAVKPLHQVQDRDGHVWVTLAGNDEVLRLTPSAGALHAGADAPERFVLPGGIAAKPPAPGVAPAPALGPGDIAVDGHGIVWVTLTLANAIARIDPAVAEPGRTDGKGITVYPLAACDATCRKPPGPATPAPLSRLPLQMRLYEDGGGNTVVLFTEQNADRIGALRVSGAGAALNETHFSCGCLQPLGIALDAEGAVWFTEGTSNRLGRLRLDQTRPFAVDTPRLDHYRIPNPVSEFVPGQPLCTPAAGRQTCNGTLPNPALTALPHSVAVDRRGRVWYTGEANERIGYLDPAQAQPGTAQGVHDAAGPDNEFGRSLAPADLAIDRAGTAYFSDEYGDQIASATVGADGAIDARRAFRPTARNSLTDAPMVDDKGNLWFIEGGANLITRITGVTAGSPLPAASPLFTATPDARRLTAEGLREMTSADVHLVRGGTEVAHADAVRVTDGGFELTLPLRADDTIRIVPRGGDNPPAAFTLRVAALTADIGPDGALTGMARIDGQPLADGVAVDTGAATATARIDVGDGSYALRGAPARGTVSWTAGGPSARMRTVVPFGPSKGAQSDGGGTPATGGGGPAGTAPRAATPGTPATPATPVAPSAPRAGGAACPASGWLIRTGAGSNARRTLPLLGLSAADARRCLGRPARTAGGRWTYPGSIELRMSGGRVTGFTLLGSALRSRPDRAAVGGTVASMRRALGRLVRSGSGYRAILALGADRSADVRLIARGGRVTRITVTTVRRPARSGR